MVAWSDVVARLGREEVIRRDATSIVVAVTSGGTRLRLRAECVTAFDEPWLLLLAPIVPEQRAKLRDALAFNARLAIGAIAIEQEWLMLRAAVPLATLDEAVLDRHLEFLARETLHLRTVCASVPAANEAFAFLDE